MPATSQFALLPIRSSFFVIHAPIRLLLLLFLLLPSAHSQSLDILYTGRLLGYFRIPDHITRDTTSCPGESTILSGPVTTFLQQVKDQRTWHSVLVGTGDNFAPDYYSRVFTPAHSSNTTIQLNEARDEWEWLKGENGTPSAWTYLLQKQLSAAQIERRLDPKIPMDPVACFLIRAQYTALVPGKHDFYFGPGRVRALHDLLKSNGIYLLGANLIRETTLRDDSRKPLPDPEGDAFIRRYGYRKSTLSLPTAITPWLRRIKLPLNIPKTQGQAVVSAMICRTDDGDPSRFEAGSRERACSDLSRSDKSHDDWRLPGVLHLTAGKAYLACVAPSGNGSLLDCQSFTVVTPFLSDECHPWASKTLTDPSNSKKTIEVSIFGVVDSDFSSHVGSLNLQYKYDNARDSPLGKYYQSSINAIDPAVVLEQQLQQCNEFQACRDSHKVLLAQMASPRANILTSRLGFPFEAVVTQTDASLATEDQSSTRYPRSCNTGCRFRTTFILAPMPIYTDSGLDIHIHRASLTSGDTATLNLRTSWNVSAQRPAVSHLAANGSAQADTTLAEMTTRYLLHDLRIQADDFSTATLRAMQSYTASDIAIIQKRDLYQPKEYSTLKISPGSVQEAIDRILWKGDFLVVRDLPGSAIKALIEKSQDFAGQEKPGADVIDLEHNRELATLGILNHHDTWLVNGKELQDKQLYSVATTDYLAFGDTGYSAFKTAAFPTPARLTQFRTLDRLSSVVCHELTKNVNDDACSSLKSAGNQYFDVTRQLPPPSRPPATFRQAVKEAIRQGVHADDPYSSSNRPSEYAQQNRTYWQLSLDKLEGTFNTYSHNSPTEKSLATKFGGISNARASTNTNSALDSSLRLRLARVGRLWEPYFLVEGEFSQASLRQSDKRQVMPGGTCNGSQVDSYCYTDVLVKTQKKNSLAFEDGINLQLLPRARYLPTLKLLVALRYQVQPIAPLTSLDYGGTLPKQVSLTGTRIFSNREGFRWQGKKSWFESGYQTGFAFRSPVGYQLNDNPNYACYAASAESSASLATCLKSFGAAAVFDSSTVVTPLLQTRFQHGLFVNFRAQLPLVFAKGLYYVVENHGDLYFNRGLAPTTKATTATDPQFDRYIITGRGDTTLDTRYESSLAQALLIPVWGNFMLKPKFEIYVFRNKGLRGDSLVGMESSIGVEYRFQWHTGLGFLNSLRYPNPPE